jgi:hypothetical protein
VYIGSRSARNHVCIYDKKQENKDKCTIDQYDGLKKKSSPDQQKKWYEFWRSYVAHEVVDTTKTMHEKVNDWIDANIKNIE